MNICFLGALGNTNLPKETKEALDDIDILFVPIDGKIMNPSDAYKLAVSLEPKIIIPCHFGSIGDKNALKAFLKEAGEEGIKPEDKLTVKKNLNKKD